jgi:hypothetical protein
MNTNEFSNPAKLEKYSFLWSEARLFIAALALLLGGIPPLLFILPVPVLYRLVGLILTVSWIISGVVSAYLVYRWFNAGQKIFGGKNQKDLIAFAVNVISGLNLGIVGILGKNIGMSISSNRIVFVIVAIIYIWSAVHLYKRFKANGEKVF